MADAALPPETHDFLVRPICEDPTMAFKTILLASALAFGGTAIAQDMTTTPPADPAAQTQTTPPPPPADPAAMPAPTPAPDPATPMQPATPMNQTAPMQPGTPMAQTPPADPNAPMAPMPPAQPMTPGTFSAQESAGGYQPATPALSGMAQPGVTPTFMAAPPVAQAYPAPAPLQSYPICKKGQTDKCRQRGG